MKADISRVLLELRLPLGPADDTLDALAVAVAIEDAFDITIPDHLLTKEHLGSRESITDLLHILGTEH